MGGGGEKDGYYPKLDSSSEDEWEEVPPLSRKELSVEAHSKEISARIPEGGLVINVPQAGGPYKAVSKYDPNELFRLHLNREIKNHQEYVHKTSLLLHLARLLKLNDFLRCEEMRALGLSMLTCNLVQNPPCPLDRHFLIKVLTWIRIKFVNRSVLEKNLDKDESLKNATAVLKCYFEGEGLQTGCRSNWLHLILLAVILLREVGFNVRLVYSLQPLPLRPLTDDLLKKPVNPKNRDEDGENNSDDTTDELKESSKKINGNSKEKLKFDGSKEGLERQSDSSDDEEPPPKKKRHGTKKKVIFGSDYWFEVYVPKERKWISVEIETGQINRDVELETKASKPVLYILGVDNNGSVKDVTRRYAIKWLTNVIFKRIDSDWWDSTLLPYRTSFTTQDEMEDNLLDVQVVTKSYPTNLKDLRKNPLYVLPQYLKKFEAIYPEDAHPAGVVKSVPFFSRDVVKTLYSKHAWLKQGKVVKLGETPYKRVKSRPKITKVSGSFTVVPRIEPSELFGEWQVTAFIPPTAKDGQVPRSEYGNVELFKAEMLPKGTVHLVLPGLPRVAKKLEIDCAPAITGFEYAGGGSHPVYDGFVVCEEFKEVLLDAWNQEQDEQEKKTEEKRLARVYGNWRKLIRGVLIKQRLAKRYSLESPDLPNDDQPSSNNLTKQTDKRKQDSPKESLSPTAKKRKTSK